MSGSVVGVLEFEQVVEYMEWQLLSPGIFLISGERMRSSEPELDFQ
jgi:hypothetical protein